MSIAEWHKMPNVSRFNSSDETARADAYMCQSDALRDRLLDTAAAMGALCDNINEFDGLVSGEYLDAARAILKRLKEEGLV